MSHATPLMQPRRIDQILSSYGYCSRSEARAWVKAERVTVDGKPAAAPDSKASPLAVRVDGELIEWPGGLLVLMHKPPGLVCSHDLREGRNVYDLLPERWRRRNPAVTTIGRLDKDTTGVLLLTDQGDLVHRWTSPKHKVEKVYEVTVDKALNPALPELFASGKLQLEDEKEPCLPAKLELVSECAARLTLIEGRFHQVKRMFTSQGYQVLKLHRSHFGTFHVEDLPPGEWRALTL